MDPTMLSALSAAAPMLTSAIGRATWKNPYENVGSTLEQIPGILKQYLDPFIQRGEAAAPTLEEQYGRLISSPADVLSGFESQYEASPRYKYLSDEMLRGINQAASAGGTMGSPAHQQQAGQMIQNLGTEDFENFINRILGLFSGGLKGLGGFEQRGFEGANVLSEGLARNIQSQALAEAARVQAEQESAGGFLGGMGKGLSSFIDVFNE